MSGKLMIIGTSNIEVSAKGENIIQPQEGWTYLPRVKHLSFMNYDDCIVRINEGQEIYLKAMQGLNLNEEGFYVDSLIIETDGIDYQFIGVC